MRYRNGAHLFAEWLLIVFIFSFGIAFCPSLRAEGVSADVKYLDTKVTGSGEEYILGQGAFEITGAPHRWYTVFFQVRLDADTPLKLKSEKEDKYLVQQWGGIFTPGNVETAQYTDCRIGLPLKEFESATNLPKGKRTLLWVVCDLWDDQNKKYIGSGWDVRAPLFLTTDRTGKVTKVETFNTGQFNPKKNHPTETMTVKASALSLKHLKLKSGAKLYRAVGGKNETYNILLMGDSQAELSGADRGYFFEPTDSENKAAELIEVGYPGGVVVETAEQYQAIVKALKAKGWKSGKDIAVDEPSSYGVSVTPAPPLGYRVAALVIPYAHYYDLKLRSVMYCEFNVASDGRIGVEKELECIVAPEPETSAPPGWVQPLPLDPGPYNEVVRSVLTPRGSREIPKVVVTEQEATIPCPEGHLTDYENWPRRRMLE